MSAIRGHHQLLMVSAAGNPEQDFGQTLYWPMQEASGTTMTETMLGVNGTYNGGALVNQTGYRAGYGSVFFDGGNDFASIAHNDAFSVGLGDYALEYWLALQYDGAYSMLFGKFADTAPWYTGVTVFANFRNNGFLDPWWMSHRTRNAGGYYQSYDIESTVSPLPPTNFYHHLSQRRTVGGATYLESYLNGSLVTSFLTAGAATDVDNASPAYIMGRPASLQTTRGHMSNLRWYRKSFTDAEVAVIYSARIS